MVVACVRVLVSYWSAYVYAYVRTRICEVIYIREYMYISTCVYKKFANKYVI